MEACDMLLSDRVGMQRQDPDLWNASYADPRVTSVVAIDPGFVWGLEAADGAGLVPEAVQHVPPDQRQRALQTLKGLLKPQGVLRLGPPEPARGVHLVSEGEMQQLDSSLGLRAERLDEQTDLLGRSNIRWVSMRLSAD
jgi:hypothetical protein